MTKRQLTISTLVLLAALAGTTQSGDAQCPGTGNLGWRRNRTVYYNVSNLPSGFREAAEAALAAQTAKNEQNNSGVRFLPGGNDLIFNENHNIIGPDGSRVPAGFNITPNNGVVLSAVIVVDPTITGTSPYTNQSVQIFDPTKPGYNDALQGVFAHEILHTMGLGHLTYPDPENVTNCAGIPRESSAMGPICGVNDQGWDGQGGTQKSSEGDCDRSALQDKYQLSDPPPEEDPEGEHTRCQCEPLVLNLDGGGLRLSAPDVSFDIDAIGRPFTVSWTLPNSGDGFLALDRNNDGRISDGRELFGSATPLSAGLSGTPAEHGLEALGFFDTPTAGGDGNGRIDVGDGIFAKLKVWVDRNHDGISDAGELLTLSEAGVVSIGLDARESGRRDREANTFRYRAPTVIERNGRRLIHYAYDVYLAWR